jgi:uncharacterized protein
MINKNPFAQLKIKYFLLIVVFIYIVVYVSYILVANIANSDFNYNDPITDCITYILYCIVICSWLQRKLHQNQISLRSLFGKLSISYRLIIRLFGLTVVFVLFSLGIVILTLSFISLTLPSFMESLIKDIDSADFQLSSMPFYYNILEIFAYVIIGPVAEEFIFRGVLLHIWAAKRKIGLSILLSSLAFGFGHIHRVHPSLAISRKTYKILGTYCV